MARSERAARRLGPRRRTGRARRKLTVDDVTVVNPDTLRRAVAAAAIGNTMEWFDFGVYSYLAVTLGKVFFPSGNPAAQLISTFATFTAAFLVRPIGGLFFGPLGDRIGRKRVLATTMITMAAGTFSIAFIPSYATIGLFAPALLLVARLVQGFSTGGEYGGATTFIAEYSPDRRRGFMGSWLEFGTLTGYSMGAGLVTLLSAVLSEHTMLTWGWRLPFLVAGPLGLIGLYLRLRLEETPAYEKITADKKQSDEQKPKRHEYREILVGEWRAMLLCLGLVLVFNVTDYMLLSYLPSYLHAALGFGETPGLLIVLVCMVIMMAVITFAGRISDHLGRRPVLMAGCIGFFLLSVPAFLLMRLATVATIFAGVLVLCLLLVCFTSTMPAALPALFPTKVRYGAMSIGFNVSVSLFGGTTPLVNEALISATGSTMVPAFYLMAAAVIGGVAVFFMRETARRPLRGSPPAVGSRREAQELVAAQRS
jgi:MHS family proline/betaine transporter-like MFS transporter